MKTKALILFLLVVFSTQAQLKVDTNGKVGVAGPETNYGSLQINKDGANNGLSFTQSNNNGSYPFRIFRKGLVGYISRNDTIAKCLRMNYDGRVSIGSTYTRNFFDAQFTSFGNNLTALSTWFYYPANNGGDAIRSGVEQPNNNAFAAWYTPASGTSQKVFYVTGTGNAYFAGSVVSLSDSTIKSDIKSIENPLDFIRKLNGVTYKNDFREEIKKNYYENINKNDLSSIENDSTYNKEKAEELMNEYDKRDMGLIAQDVEKVLPDLVYNVGNNKKGIVYTQLIALLIEGMKEQQKEIEILNEKVSAVQGIPKIESSKIASSLNNSTTSETSNLYQNIPNPFTTQTQISYFLSTTAINAQLCIYNLSGQQLRCVKLTETGSGTVTIQANELQAGIYLYSLIVDGKEAACKRMVLTE